MFGHVGPFMKYQQKDTKNHIFMYAITCMMLQRICKKKKRKKELVVTHMVDFANMDTLMLHVFEYKTS